MPQKPLSAFFAIKNLPPPTLSADIESHIDIPSLKRKRDSIQPLEINNDLIKIPNLKKQKLIVLVIMKRMMMKIHLMKCIILILKLA